MYTLLFAKCVVHSRLPALNPPPHVSLVRESVVDLLAQTALLLPENVS